MGREVRAEGFFVTEGLVLDCALPNGHDWAVGNQYLLRFFPGHPELRLGVEFSVEARVGEVVRVRGERYVVLPPAESDAAPEPIPPEVLSQSDLAELTAVRGLALEVLSRWPPRSPFAYAAVRDHPLNAGLRFVIAWVLGHSFQNMALLREQVQALLRSVPPLEEGPRCSPHFLPAPKTCDRCGAFWCEWCEGLMWSFGTCRLCLESPPSLIREVMRYVESSRLRWIALGTAGFGLLLQPFGDILGGLGVATAVASLWMSRGIVDRRDVAFALLGIAVSIGSVVRSLS
jgi:hypothetical protein